MFLKNKNIIFKIRRSKVTDYAALSSNTGIYAYVMIGHTAVFINNLRIEHSLQSNFCTFPMCSKIVSLLFP